MWMKVHQSKEDVFTLGTKLSNSKQYMTIYGAEVRVSGQSSICNKYKMNSLNPQQSCITILLTAAIDLTIESDVHIQCLRTRKQYKTRYPAAAIKIM